MHRCVGGCFYKTPDVFHCVTKNASIVQVKTIEYNTETGDFNDKKVEQVKNDTECDCECIVQEHHCDKETEIYNPDTCQCDCRDLSHTCNAILKVSFFTSAVKSFKSRISMVEFLNRLL